MNTKQTIATGIAGIAIGAVSVMGLSSAGAEKIKVLDTDRPVIERRIQVDTPVTQVQVYTLEQIDSEIANDQKTLALMQGNVRRLTVSLNAKIALRAKLFAATK